MAEQYLASLEKKQKLTYEKMKIQPSKNQKNLFVNGAITPGFIAGSIAKHQAKKEIGAHDIFLGQVRNDILDGKEIIAIEYSAFKELSEDVAANIRNEAFEKYELTCLHIYHSLGWVNAGDICLFVFTSSKHRHTAFDANRFVVEEIKQKLPVWGKEIFADHSYAWKTNTPLESTLDKQTTKND